MIATNLIHLIKGHGSFNADEYIQYITSDMKYGDIRMITRGIPSATTQPPQPADD
jgi:hypothetical protein